MAKFGLPLVLLLTLGFCLTVDSNPISALFGKSNGDDKTETEDKAAATTTTTTTAKPGDAATATAADSSSSCGGLKGFLHICDKTEPVEAPKSVKTRSVDDDDDSDSDSDEESEEEQKEEGKEVTEASSATSEGEVAKREAEDSEVSPAVDDALSPPIEPEDDGGVEKRQAEEESEEEEEEDSTEGEPESSRKRRDCRDRYGDDGKDCRKKRELVPKITSDVEEEVKEEEAGEAENE